jgi:hypothetical protein
MELMLWIGTCQSKYDDIAEPYIYKVGDFVYKNKAWKESEVAVEEYKKLCDELRTNVCIYLSIYLNFVFNIN